MKNKAPKRHFLKIMVLVAMVVGARPGLAATATELFEDGNRLFRDDLYFAALLRYREAAAAGMDTPLLHYNTGVAHYKAGQHVRARQELQTAATYGPLAAISHYNLGLNAYALGEYEEAGRWFRRAAAQEERPDIARLARRALRQLDAELEAKRPVTVAAAKSERDRQLTNFELRVRSGAGIDDNVYRTPDESYVDLSDPANPTVEPIVQSSVYIPISMRARYQVNALENEGFFGSYSFGGRFYPDKNLDNANEYLHEIGFGSEFHKSTEDRETRLYSAFKIAQHAESYYDPDNGTNRDAGGVDISDRMSYLRYGPEFWLRHRIRNFTFGFRAKGQLWNYEDVVVVPEYDHEYWLIGLNTQFRLSPTSLLRLDADYYTRRYGDRPSYDLDGTISVTNPDVRYDYLDVSLEARQRITDALWLGIGYGRTDREDRYVGYNNYVRDEYRVQLHWRFGDRFLIEAVGGFYNYDYENAYAFQEPTAGRKTLQRSFGSMEAAFRMTRHLDLVAEYVYQDTASNDTRLDYTRSQAMLAVRWSQ